MTRNRPLPVLVGGKTICAGYAEALYFLYNLAGIECITQDGWVLGSDGNGAHRWAEARIDGEWYLFDATWDEGWPASSFRYFGLSDATLQERSPRDVTTYDREHCPPCPEDLPHP